VVDRLTKTAHFIAVNNTYSAKDYAEIYLDRVVRLHGIPKTIISDQGPQFISRFWERLHESLGTKLICSSAYHPQTDGQTERVNQIVEDMLRACIIHFDKSWDKCLALEEFAYNNSYQASLKMAPFEALYGRRCRTPLNWSQVGERKFFGPNLVKEAEERVEVIKKLKSRANEAKELPWRGENCKGIPSWRESVLRVSPTTRVQ
jgi:transposase InsO family protein